MTLRENFLNNLIYPKTSKYYLFIFFYLIYLIYLYLISLILILIFFFSSETNNYYG